MGNKITEVVFIVDRSGSMAGFEKDTVGGINSTLERQKKEEGTVYVSTVFFSNQSEVIHDRVTIDKVAPLTEDDFVVGGCTALLDAIGGAIHHIGNIHKYARPEDVPEHTIFVITTDGMENASHQYSRNKVKSMIERQKKEYGWEFIFLAANIDVEQAAGSFGIDNESAISFHQDRDGVIASYCSIADAISLVRADKDLNSGSWKSVLEKDNARRKKNQEGK